MRKTNINNDDDAVCFFALGLFAESLSAPLAVLVYYRIETDEKWQ